MEADPQPPEDDDKDLEAELAEARQLVENEPDNAEAHERLGNLLAQADPEAARRCWERAVAKNPAQASAHYNLGQYHQLHQDAVAQRAHFEQALAAQPDDTQILQKVIQSCMRLSEYSDAQKYRSRLLDVLAAAPKPPRTITIDQFPTAAGEHCFVLEPLDGGPDLRYLYVFRFTRDGRGLGTVNLETTADLRERGLYAVLGMDRGSQHTTFQLAWSTPPAYQELKEAALRAWRGEVPVGARSQ